MLPRHWPHTGSTPSHLIFFLLRPQSTLACYEIQRRGRGTYRQLSHARYTRGWRGTFVSRGTCPRPADASLRLFLRAASGSEVEPGWSWDIMCVTCVSSWGRYRISSCRSSDWR
ncbi:hypothetical protein CALVIDRAFT_262420 [Calocera viscosa TUFC12733]|uniref:Uncharacterized protein n=1 Tax=Calocera viscosa (strain TUFC12733) TaxID=1330018 RepID=A0A167J3E7_CALVF|nr:hypothetical protein CALVIDRAFT_262420 [Calocera viscosa TUFC12733]